MGAWHSTYANLLRSRFSALVAYAEALVDDHAAARELAQAASVEVFSRRQSPRDTHSAELAAREWMAVKAVKDGVSADHAATVMFALDGLDDNGVRAVLKRATPDPLPDVTAETSNAIRSRYSQTAAVYATPSGGVNTVMEPARRRRRSGLTSTAAGTTAAVAVVALGAWFGLNHLPTFPGSAAEPTPSGSPSANLLAVTWDPEPDYEAATASFHFPECGQQFDPKSQGVGGVTPVPIVVPRLRDPAEPDFLALGYSFASDGGEKMGLLAIPYGYVITKDGAVVFTSLFPGDASPGLDYFTTNASATGAMGSGDFGLGAESSCEAQEAQQKYFDQISGLSQAKQDKMWEKFNKKWAKFEPGVYEVYVVTPMVFGEQAALAQAFALDGIGNTSSLSGDLAWSPVAQDPRVSPYCSGSMDDGSYTCSVPPDVVKEVLTKEVDPTTVNDTEPGMGISEPVEFTVD